MAKIVEGIAVEYHFFVNLSIGNFCDRSN